MQPETKFCEARNGVDCALSGISDGFAFAPYRGAGDPDVQVWLRQTSLTAHPFFGACELAALRASSDKRTLFPEKKMLRSAGRRGGGSIKRS